MIVSKVHIENICLMILSDKVIITKTILDNIFQFLIIRIQRLNPQKSANNLNKFQDNLNN
jgi:hypothetical protein